MMTKSKTFLLASLATLFASGVASPNAAGQETRGSKIEEVTVTAQRRAEAAQDVPVAISAFSRNMTDSLSFVEPKDVANFTPNFQQTGPNGTGGVGLNTVTIRGLGVSGSGNFILSSSGILTYHDDIASGTTFTSDLPFWDLERIEVLRGPQGTLFGRGALGGAVKYISASPTDEFEGYGEFEAGEFNLRKFEGAVGGPITDKIKARVSFLTYDRGGDIKNTLLDVPKGEREWWGARGIVDWEPTDDLSIRVKYQHYEAEVDTNFFNDARREDFTDENLAFMDAIGADVELDRQSNFEKQKGGLIRNPGDDYNLEIAQINVDQRIGPGMLKGIGGFMKAKSDRLFDVVPVPAPIDWGYAPTRFEQWSGEIRYESDPGALSGIFEPLSFIAGAYFQTTDSSSFEANDFTALLRDLDGDGRSRHNPDSPEDLRDGLFPNPAFAGARTVTKDTGTIQKLDTWAIFLHGEYDLTDRLTTTGAVRFTSTEKNVDFFFNAFFDFPLSPGITPSTIGQFQDFLDFAKLTGNPQAKRDQAVAILDDPNAVDANGNVVPTPAGNSWEELTFKFGLDYALSNDAMIYGSLSKGFKGGNFVSLAATPNTTNAADPTTSLVWEVGAKTEWFDRRVQVNVNGFFNQLDDFQATLKLQGGVINALSNISRTRIFGGEIQLTANPVENLFFVGNFGVLRTDIREVRAGNENLLGNELSLVERQNFSGLVRYDVPTAMGIFTPQVDWRYRGPFWSQKENDDIGGPIGDFWTFNIRLLYESMDGKVYGGLFLENVADKVDSVRAEIPSPNALGGTLTNVNERRNWGVTVGYRF